MFEQLSWQKDHMRLGQLIFRLEPNRSDDWLLGDNYFNLYKEKGLYDQYEQVFAGLKNFQPQNILELGLWDGGSLVIWNEVLKPGKIVGMDLNPRSDSAYFESYVNQSNFQDKVKTYWGADQADVQLLERIVSEEFDGALDLVIDDASHLYDQTKISFETLFPLLAPGGLYVIEDWAWSYWTEYNDHPYFKNTVALSRLVVEIMEMIGSTRDSISPSLIVMPGLIVVKKDEPLSKGGERFRLDDRITRRTKHFAPPELVRVLD